MNNDVINLIIDYNNFREKQKYLLKELLERIKISDKNICYYDFNLGPLLAARCLKTNHNNREYIRYFVWDVDYEDIKIPKRYIWSSGMTHPSGFKLKNE